MKSKEDNLRDHWDNISILIFIIGVSEERKGLRTYFRAHSLKSS